MVVSTRLLLSGTTFWGWVLAGLAINRATSYWFRPPAPGQPKILVETVVPYHVWAGLLVLSGLLILASTLDRRRWLIGCFGHVLALGCYGAFTASTVLGAVFRGMPWAGAGVLAATGLLHFGRLLAVAEGGHSGTRR